MAPTATQKPGASTAPKSAGQNIRDLQRELVDGVMEKVNGLLEAGELTLPRNYSPGNALRSAWLILQDLTAGPKEAPVPVLEYCTKASISNSLLRCVLQGLNPDKAQCYFIAYGAKLACQRSYFGDIMVTKRLVPEVVDIFAEVVYKGDELEYEIRDGHKIVTLHRQKLENVRPDNILGAYAGTVLRDPLARRQGVLMTWGEIRTAWSQARPSPVLDDGSIKPGTNHFKFPGEMAKRTALARLCKPLINTSDDSSLYAEEPGDPGSELAVYEGPLDMNLELDPEPGEVTVDPVAGPAGPADEPAAAGDPTAPPAADKAPQAAGGLFSPEPSYS